MLSPTGWLSRTQVCRNDAPLQTANRDLTKNGLSLPSPFLHSSNVIVRAGSGATVPAPAAADSCRPSAPAAEGTADACRDRGA